MDHRRSTNKPEITLEYCKNELSEYLNKAITKFENKNYQSSKAAFANSICKYVRKCINENNQGLIPKYLQRQATSDKYKEHFGNIPIGPARGNGEGGSSTSAATWSAGGDSTSATGSNHERAKDRTDFEKIGDLNKSWPWS